MKTLIVAAAFAMLAGATAIHAWQVRATKAQSQPAAGASMSSPVPVTTTTLW